MPVHGIRKTAKASVEKLPDVSGTPVTYAGNTDKTTEVTERVNTEPTVEAGSSGSAGGYTGVIEQQVATILPQYKLDGAVVWEKVTTLSEEL
ncbi:MAG: hypothetical protein JW990_12905 [Thermoleophilia bacterium]|nr:hypothetical protein [Thermoleophilia bacterium]